jgi:predicted transcriptional regulator
MRSGIPDDRDSDGQWKRAEKQARSIKYQLTVAKLPLAKDVDNAAGAVREKWNLPFNYPMVAPNYAAQRSALVKQIGLGQIRRKAVVARVPAGRREGE